MKYLKLLLLSIFFFGLLFFLISLLFPAHTYVSRVINVWGKKTALAPKLDTLFSAGFLHDKNFIKTGIAQAPAADTLQFSTTQSNLTGGVAIHEVKSDSAALQVYFHVHVPWYQFWHKFGLMINEQKYGPALDSALNRMKNSPVLQP